MLNTFNKKRSITSLIEYQGRSYADSSASYAELTNEGHIPRPGLLYNETIQTRNEAFGEFLDRWHHMAHLEMWLDWTADMLKRPTCQMAAEIFDDLAILNSEMLLWQHRVPDHLNEFKAAFDYFHTTLDWFLNHFSEFKGSVTSDGNYSIQLPAQLHTVECADLEYQIHIDNANHPSNAFDDAIVKLTKGANFITDLVTENLAPTYRESVGSLKLYTMRHGDRVPLFSECEKHEKADILKVWSEANGKQKQADYLNYAHSQSKVFA